MRWSKFACNAINDMLFNEIEMRLKKHVENLQLEKDLLLCPDDVSGAHLVRCEGDSHVGQHDPGKRCGPLCGESWQVHAWGDTSVAWLKRMRKGCLAKFLAMVICNSIEALVGCLSFEICT